MTTQPKLAEFKVRALPGTLIPNARYVVKADDVDYVQEYITDAQGIAFPHRADSATLADAEAAKAIAEQNAAWALAHAQSAKFEADRAQSALSNVVNAGGIETQYTQVLDDIATAFDGARVQFDLNLGGNDVLPYSAAQILWTLGGVPQKAGVDFTVLGSILTALVAPSAGLSSELRLLQSYIDSDANATTAEAIASAIDGKADKATTLAGYGIADAYTKAETDGRIEDVVGAAPAALDTLAEIATQLQSDETAASALGGTVAGHIGSTSNPHGVTKSQVGLGNCDNTSDAAKPVSTAQQTALDGKVPTTRTVAGHALSGDVTLDRADVGLGNVLNVAQLSTVDSLDDISAAFNGVTTTFALTLATATYTPTNVHRLIITLGGVVQTDCMLSGANLTFAAAPAAGLSCKIRAIA